MTPLGNLRLCNFLQKNRKSEFINMCLTYDVDRILVQDFVSYMRLNSYKKGKKAIHIFWRAYCGSR